MDASDEPPPFDLTVSDAGDARVVSPEGELDMATAPALREALRGEAATSLVLDLRKVTFMDTSGLQVLIESARAAEEQGRTLHVVRGTNAVQRLLDIAGLTPRLHLVDAPEQVLEGPAGDAL